MTGPSDITLFSKIKLRHPCEGCEGLGGEIARIGFGPVAFSVFPGSIPVCFCYALAQEKLHAEEFGDGRGAVALAGEAMFEAIARRREGLAGTGRFVLCLWSAFPCGGGL